MASLKLEQKGEYIHTVRRKLKSGKIKEYKYAEQRKSTLLFKKTTHGGVTKYTLIKKNWQAFEDKIKREIKDPAEQASVLNEARRVKMDILSSEPDRIQAGKGRHYASGRQLGWNRIDVNSLISRMAADKAAKFLINMGLRPEEVASRYNIDLDELLNDGNWIENVWSGKTKAGNDLTLTFTFDYNGFNNITAEGGD